MPDPIPQPNIQIDVNVELVPFGHVTVASAFAHAYPMPAEEEARPLVTQVLPLSSSLITPGHARPISG